MIENRLRKVHRVKQSLMEEKKCAEFLSSLLERTIEGTTLHPVLDFSF
jgi:hypothetical protein